MTDAITSFVQQGISRYAEAREAVTFFETQVFDILAEAVAEAVADGVLQRIEQPARRRVPGGGGAHWYLGYFETVRCGAGNVRLEVGLWWNSSDPDFAGPVILYANLRDGDEALLRFPFIPHENVRELRAPEWTRVQLPVTETSDLRRDVSTLLAAMKIGIAAALEKASGQV